MMAAVALLILAMMCLLCWARIPGRPSFGL
jgi:hypothetical protein